MQEPAITTVKTEEEVAALCEMAARIWTEHYRPIIGEDQTAYMVEKYQSVPAVSAQLQHGYAYYFICEEGKPAGYIGIVQEEDRLFLSKLYIDRAYRGHGLARKALDFLRKLCKERGLACIYLTVNRNNAGSVAAYEKMGFQKVREQVAEIGGGYVMDDYIMELPV